MNKRFIVKPIIYDLPQKQLHYTDLLTYTAIRSFHNSDDKRCFPGYETIAKRMGASKGFVIKSVKRLTDAKVIHTLKSDRRHMSNNYLLNDIEYIRQYDKIPPLLLNADDLSIYEKAMLLALRQFTISIGLDIGYSLQTIAGRLGITYKTIYTQVKSLLSKGYLISSSQKKPLTALKFSTKINWIYQVIPQPKTKVMLKPLIIC